MIVEDHTSIRQLLTTVIDSWNEFKIVGEAGSGVEAVKLIRQLRPDLIVLDLLLPQLSGRDVLRRVKKDSPRSKVLLYTCVTDPTVIGQVLEDKPFGFVGKTDSLDTLHRALKTVAAGQIFFTPFASRVLVSSLSRRELSLSDREREILQLITEGKSSKEIADVLRISIRTVENHRANMLERFEVHSIVQLVRIAIKAGWIN